LPPLRLPPRIRILHLPVIACLVVACLLSGKLHAAPGDDEFHRGVTAFRSQDYEGARRHFEQARLAGLDTAALHYNLGSTLYKLGRYDEAQQSFAACARDPAWASLALYNMGLAALAQGRQADAADSFLKSWRNTDDDKLASLAFAMLERTDPQALTQPRSSVSLAAGYDSNVVLANNLGAGLPAGAGDSFTELLATIVGRTRGATDAPRWSASFYDLRYVDLRDFSISDIGLGLELPLLRDIWRHELGGQLHYVWRGGSSYQQNGALYAGTNYEKWRNLLLRFRLRYEMVRATDDAYQFLDGSSLEVGTSVMQLLAGGSMNYGIGYERNNREDLADQGNFYSYSPERVSIWWRGSWPTGGRWLLEPSVRYRQSRYAGVDQHDGLSQSREDTEWEARAAVKYRIVFPWQLTGEYLYTTNRSNFPEFSYHRNQLLIGITRPL